MFIVCLQANANNFTEFRVLKGLRHNKQLVTVYLEHNPIASDVQYRNKVRLELPWLQQIDATLCRN